MSSNLPEKIEPVKMAHKGTCLQGQLPLRQMPRLMKELCSDKGDVSVSLKFGIDEQRYNYLKGEVCAELHLICQRCLEPVIYPVKTEFCLSPVEDVEAADKLPERYEPVVLKGSLLLLADVVEEELLLNIPIAAKHPDGGCKLNCKR